MKRHCFALDLIDNAKLISAYKEYHKNVWSEITNSIKDSGIINLEIYLVANRLFMIMEVDNTFTFEKKYKMDSNNTKVQEWETLMWNYQQVLPTAKKGEKWVIMEKIFQL